MSTPVNRLLCAHCHYPLSPPSGQATGMHCPRCNTWLDIDPACSGSCISCHKLHQIESKPCTEASCSTDSKNEAQPKERSLIDTVRALAARVFNGR